MLMQVLMGGLIQSSLVPAFEHQRTGGCRCCSANPCVRQRKRPTAVTHLATRRCRSQRKSGTGCCARRRGCDRDGVAPRLNRCKGSWERRGQWISARRGCCSLHPLRGLQQRCSPLRTMAPAGIFVIAWQGNSRQHSHNSDRDHHFDQSKTLRLSSHSANPKCALLQLPPVNVNRGLG